MDVIELVNSIPTRRTNKRGVVHRTADAFQRELLEKLTSFVPDLIFRSAVVKRLREIVAYNETQRAQWQRGDEEFALCSAKIAAANSLIEEFAKGQIK